MEWICKLVTVAIGLVLHSTVCTAQFRGTRLNGDICQGMNHTIICPETLGFRTVMEVKSVTVMTHSNVSNILYESEFNAQSGCQERYECLRTIHKATDEGISDDYRHLYQYIANKCHGHETCDLNLPEYWNLIDTRSTCGQGVQYFQAVKIDIQCWANAVLTTVGPPPSTTPRTKPTTPTTTTPFPVVFAIYQPELIGLEKVILGVAIGLAIAILIVLLIVLYCCEKYRNHKRVGKLLRMLGAPQAQEDAFDELDFGKTESWQDETLNLDALGEYTGVKPDEFLTLDKKTMESTGQIMYDTLCATVQKTGISCSTIDRLDHKKNGFHVSNDYIGPVDYDTDANLDLEERMAATLQFETDSGVSTAYQENLV